MFDPIGDPGIKFTVVIPTYRRPDALKKCLSALDGQSDESGVFEVVVVNDGGDKIDLERLSRDIHKFALKILHLSANKGPAAARNYGLDHSRGDMILFLDDDSVPLPDWFSKITLSWEEHEGFAGIGGYVTYNENDNIVCKVNCDMFNWFLDQNISSGYANFLATCNAGYKKSVLIKTGGFDERFRRAAGEDRDLNVRVVKNGGRLKLDKGILVYHERDISASKFLRKNFYYGKASYMLHKKHPEMKFLSPRGYTSLYKDLLRKRADFIERTEAILLIFLAHGATLIGYSTALLGWR